MKYLIQGQLVTDGRDGVDVGNIRACLLNATLSPTPVPGTLWVLCK